MKTVKAQIEVQIRSKEPHRRNWNKKGVIYPGFEVEVIDEKTGEEIDGNDVWYQDKNGDFYWSGGFEIIGKTDISLNVEGVDAKLDWWQKQYEIEKLWTALSTTGEGTEITIIDSGIDLSSIYFNQSKITGVSVVSDTIQDNLGHGTKVASIVAGNGVDFIGAAPGAKLFVIKYYDTALPLAANLIDALKQVPESSDAVVISSGFLSQDISSQQKTTMQAIINKLANRTPIFCSVGDDFNHDDNAFSRYPSALDKTISVASVGKDRLVCSFSTKSDHVDIAAPGAEMKVIGLNNTLAKDSGSSFSSPLLGALVSLFKAKFNDISNPEIAARLVESCDPQTNVQLYGKGIVNPIKTLNSFK
ncbi:Intracellular serine protease [Fulvivirga imtechensis AK7]|uniref:Intracellular serine protease n=1 Tax=Fulvivirga imtechensis AK7 TaxID=1237149 RepID=L8JLB4_9BACT|nr:S8/S53 family peptidase [Fulvivirga imtechensis]ELR69038.1 Intracellular serine protease [Fulvivirga imtechensis AK7]